VTALCNEPEALASDVSDDQSRYFIKSTGDKKWIVKCDAMA